MKGATSDMAPQLASRKLGARAEIRRVPHARADRSRAGQAHHRKVLEEPGHTGVNWSVCPASPRSCVTAWEERRARGVRPAPASRSPSGTLIVLLRALRGRRPRNLLKTSWMSCSGHATASSISSKACEQAPKSQRGRLREAS